MKKADKNKCKYCGNETFGKDMCNTCKNKLPLVRELVAIGEPYRKILAQRNEAV